MSDRISIGIDVDTSQAEVSITDLQERIDQQARDMKIHRNTILRQIREGFTMISQLMSAFRQAMSLFGAQIDPFFSALIGMVLSTASMLISAGTTLALTGIGGAVAAVILGLAISFQILTTAKLVADQESIQQGFRSMVQDLQTTLAGARGRQSPFGGPF